MELIQPVSDDKTNTGKDKITTKEYWESYYKKSKPIKEKIIQIGSSYDKYWSVFIEKENQTVIEIGATPGNYLAYLSSKYNLYPVALDFQSDTSKISESLEIMGVTDYEIINEDFTSWKPNQEYDRCISLGFIEHFENYFEIIKKHCELLKVGGKVFFTVPNLRFFRKLYGQIADRDNLKAHNLKVMSLDVFRKAAIQNNMEIELLEYVGPFQFGLHGELNTFRKIVYKSSRLLFKTLKLSNLTEKYPSKFWSASIICVMRKK